MKNKLLNIIIGCIIGIVLCMFFNITELMPVNINDYNYYSLKNKYIDNINKTNDSINELKNTLDCYTIIGDSLSKKVLDRTNIDSIKNDIHNYYDSIEKIKDIDVETINNSFDSIDKRIEYFRKRYSK